jgi:DNA-binding CsgD family transcriptional regulator
VAVVSSWTQDRCGERIDRACRAGLDWPVLAGEVISQLRKVAGFDTWCFALRDPISGLPSNAAADNPPLVGRVLRLWQLEHGQPDVLSFASLTGSQAKVGTLRQATAGDPCRSRRFAEILGPAGMGDELRAVCMAGGTCWAAVTLYQAADMAGFAGTAADFLQRVLPSLAAAARAHWARDRNGQWPTGDHGIGPGTILLTGTGTVISLTSEAQHWLARLQAGLPFLAPLIGLLIARDSASFRAHTPDGRWLEIHGSRLTPPGGYTSFALTLQPARDEVMTPLLLHAAGLTPRQHEIAQLLLAGRTTSEIAGALRLSPHTVNDTAKAITAKLGVSGRRELAARLTGTRM